jgi:hypothetical protein
VAARSGRCLAVDQIWPLVRHPLSHTVVAESRRVWAGRVSVGHGSCSCVEWQMGQMSRVASGP